MRIERRIQVCGEKQAVVDVQTLGIGFAIRPGDDVAGAQEPGVADASDRAGSIPEQHQRFAEHLLAYAFLAEPLYLGCAGLAREAASYTGAEARRAGCEQGARSRRQQR